MPTRMNARVAITLLRASVAMAFAVFPYHVVVQADVFGIAPTAALAKDGHSGGGNSGGDGSGGDHSGRGGGDGASDDHSGSGRGDNNDHSGSGRGGSDDHAGTGGRDDGANDDADEHVNPATGERVEINGNDIEVVHPDGTKEEIENG